MRCLGLALTLTLLVAATQATPLPASSGSSSWYNWAVSGVRRGAYSALGSVQSVAQSWFGSEEQSGQEWPPSFCNGLECPRYTVVEVKEDYEVRQYAPSQWVSAGQYCQQGGGNLESIYRELFMSLFRYISGNNEQSVKVAMTTPVVGSAALDQGPACPNNYTMSFFVAPETSPPKPTVPTMDISTKPAFTAYVRTFGGYATVADFREQGRALYEALPESTRTSRRAKFYSLTYDSPFTFLNRHNEIMFVA